MVTTELKTSRNDNPRSPKKKRSRGKANVVKTDGDEVKLAIYGGKAISKIECVKKINQVLV